MTHTPSAYQLASIQRGELGLVVVRLRKQPNLQYRSELYRAVVDGFGCVRWYYDDIVDGPNRIAEAAGDVTSDGRPINFISCPLGKPGDVVACKEKAIQIGHERTNRNGTYRWPKLDDEAGRRWFDQCCHYAIDLKPNDPAFIEPHGTLPASSMPLWASRYSLLIKSVEVRKVCEITEAESLASGIERRTNELDEVWFHAGDIRAGSARAAFQEHYIKQHGPASFDTDFAWFVSVAPGNSKGE